MKQDTFVLKGAICYSKDVDTLSAVEQGYVVCENGKIAGVFEQLPERFSSLEQKDYSNHLILPGLIDLHLHAPQFSIRGMGMDLELLEWLNHYVFPEESKYRQEEYAQKAYEIFADDLKNSATTRACIFATIHQDSTLLLMDLMEKTGLYSYIGKVNMDRNSPDFLIESSEQSISDTISWLETVKEKHYHRTFPILTPRFIPTCSDQLMAGLQQIQEKYQLAVQSHLSENTSEIEWVKSLCPSSSCYGDAYRQFGFFGGDVPTIMAHCVHSGDTERKMMKENGVYIAHCPESNSNLSSGIAPAKQYLQEGMRIGLGSDVAGGSNHSLFSCMAHAIQVSKLRWKLVDSSFPALTLAEAFYMATKGGGSFFGQVGSLEPGYEADILVINDSSLRHPQPMSVPERLERIIYLSDDRCIKAKYVFGQTIFEK